MGMLSLTYGKRFLFLLYPPEKRSLDPQTGFSLTASTKRCVFLYVHSILLIFIRKQIKNNNRSLLKTELATEWNFSVIILWMIRFFWTVYIDAMHISYVQIFSLVMRKVTSLGRDRIHHDDAPPWFDARIKQINFYILCGICSLLTFSCTSTLRILHA